MQRPPGETPLRWIDVVHKVLASLHSWLQMMNNCTMWRAYWMATKPHQVNAHETKLVQS